MNGPTRVAIGCFLALSVLGGIAACADEDEGEGAGQDRQRPVIGFLYVGSISDHGYNQAAYQGSLAIKRAYPRARIIQAQRVPESEEAARVMQGMIEAGATIIFPTSFGHLRPALDVAARNPRVTFFHQGGLETAPNLGTFFSRIWEVQYASGQAAALSVRSGKIGYVAAFPIAQALLGINAYERGARSVNPHARTRVVFTRSWCDPARQRSAVRALLRWGADVLTQHQDCTATVIRAAERAGVKTTGFHADASALAPRAWLTGSEWRWGRLYVDMVRTAVEGRFAASVYAGRYHGGLADGSVGLAQFGRSVPESVRRRVRETARALSRGRRHPFRGPVRDQQGNVRIHGREPDVTELEETDYLVEGVEGHVPGA